MSVSNKTIPFPNDWDINNPGAVDFYNKCIRYAESNNDFYDMIKISHFFIYFALSIIVFILFTNLWLFRYYKSYVFKRQCRKYYFCLMLGSLIILIDICLLEMNYETYPCILHHALTGIGYPLYISSFGLIIIKYFKYYYKSQIAYFNSFLNFLDERHNETLYKNFIFKKFYTNISSSVIIKVLMAYLFFNLIYSIIMYFFDEGIASNGFCSMRFSYTPQIIEFTGFIVIFLPLVFIEALNFDDKFKMKYTIIMSLLLHIILFSGYLISLFVNSINCSIIVQYVPPGFFVILSCLSSTLLFTLFMLKDILYLNKCNKNLKGTYKGMIKMLEDKILFREFGEFCRNENCVENILFFKEYWKYKKLFSKTEKSSSLLNIESTKSQEFNDSYSSIYTKSNHEEGGFLKGNVLNEFNERVSSIFFSNVLNDNKSQYPIIVNEANKFCGNFIGSKAIYEINIQNSIVTKIFNTMNTLNDNSDQNIDEKLDEYYIIFDDAYKEVTNNIYLNSYSNYVHQKIKENEKKRNK